MHARLLAVLTAIVVATLSIPAVSQTAGEVRTKDGRVICADSIQFRGDRVILVMRGLPPIEIPMSNIQSVEAACGSTPGAPPPTARDRSQEPGFISVQGSNTIGATLM